MKKFNIFFKGTILMFFLISLTGYSQSCDFTLEMIDSYGDTWNGNTMSVAVNGTTVLSNVSDTSFDGLTTIAFSVNTGDAITATWHGGGAFAYETSYRILDNAGALVGSGDESDVSVTAACISNPGIIYCGSIPSSNDGQGITNLVLGSTSTSLPDVTYHNLTGTVVDAQQGIGLNTEISFETSFYSYDANIWIDFGDDGNFDAGDQVFGPVEALSGSSIMNATFTVPAGAPLGEHRMRIGTADSGQGTPDPCYNGSYGVTIDATINIIEPLCAQATIASSEVAEDCGNLQFFVDVDISSGGDALSITDGTTVWAINNTGVNTVGPFDSYTSVNLTVTHSDAACDINLGDFIYNCPPANDACDSATEIVCGSVATGTTEYATSETLDCDGFTLSATGGVWHSMIGTGGDIHLNTDDSSFDTKLAVFSGSCGTLVCVASDDDGGAGTRSDLTFSSNAGENYLVYITGYFSSSVGDYTLTVDCICEAGIQGGGCQDVYDSSFAPLASTELTAFGQFGLAPYTFVWSDGQTGETITVAPTTTTVYEVTVTDAAGCTNMIQTTVLVTDVSCSNGNGNQAKVIVCHNGEELCISPNAVQAHLNHGDSIGACDVIVSCDTPPLCDSRLKVPNSGAIDIPLDIEISWGASTGYVSGYLLSVGTTPGGVEVIDGEDVGTDLSYSLDGELNFGTTYYVTIVSYNGNGEGASCESSSFTTVQAPWIIEATPIACNSTGTGNVLDGNVNDYLIGCGGVTGAQGVWYSFVGDGYEMTASTCGLAGFDTEIAIFEGENSLSCVANNDDGDDCGTESEVSFNSTAGQTYYMYVTSYSATSFGRGPFSVSLTCPGPAPENEACSFADSISCGDTVTGSTLGYDSNDFDFCGTSTNTAPGRFYKVEGTGESINVDTFGSSFDTKLAVFSGSCSLLTCVGGDDDTNGPQSQVIFDSDLGAIYYIYVTGFGTNAGNFTLNVTCSEPPVLPACDGIYVDSGGDSGNYSASELSTTTISPDVAGDAVTVTFTYVDLESSSSTGVQDGCWDFLTIYNGPSTSSPVLAQTLCGEESGDGNTPGTASSLLSVGMSFTSTDASGALTFVFTSDSSVQETGWVADITCGSSSARTTAADWNLYPNPATNGEVELDLTKYLNKDLEIQMMDNSGKLLINKSESNLQNPRYKMNTQNVSNGLYLIRIVTDSGVSVKKLIIAN